MWYRFSSLCFGYLVAKQFFSKQAPEILTWIIFFSFTCLCSCWRLPERMGWWVIFEFYTWKISQCCIFQLSLIYINYWASLAAWLHNVNTDWGSLSCKWGPSCYNFKWWWCWYSSWWWCYRRLAFIRKTENIVSIQVLLLYCWILFFCANGVS